jgi:DNA-binding response OmpR family regulator
MSFPTILLLDEEPLLRRATAMMLTNRGGKVSAAATVEEAVALAERRRFDIAVLDVASGDATVGGLLGRIFAAGRMPRRVIVCSPPPLERREASVLAEVLIKPYPFDRLLLAVFGLPGRRNVARAGVLSRLRPAATRLARKGSC